jgi:DNA-binding GntR family transcriptional regulator
MARSALSPQIATRIVEYIRAGNFRRGQHLPSQMLADAFRVSRAPVNAALKALEDLKVVRSEPNRGYFLAKDADELDKLRLPAANGEGDEQTYFAIAEDRLAGKLPDRLSENELMRIYDVPRSRLLKVLNRIAQEGWIERLPGNGWEFRPTLTSKESYEAGYRFRAAIEAAAVRQPTFRVDRAAFAEARAKQRELLDGAMLELSRSELFEINSEFHEMVVGCAQNEFFLDAIKRVNQLRRLIEYRVTGADRSRLTRQCREHLKILDLLEAGDRAEAAEFLRKHIEGARAIKAGGLG